MLPGCARRRCYTGQRSGLVPEIDATDGSTRLLHQLRDAGAGNGGAFGEVRDPALENQAMVGFTPYLGAHAQAPRSRG